MKNIDLKKIIASEYLINVLNIEKNNESTVGNVYIIYTNNIKYVLKIYDDLDHVKSMTLLHTDLSNKFYIPKIIQNKNTELYTKINGDRYIVLYSFLEGIQIGKLDNFDSELVRQIALEVRKLHELTSTNNYNLNEVAFCKNYDIDRKSLLHFDLTKGNIFSIENKIGFIDFDDAKYGPSVCDVAILISLLFLSKKRGIDIVNLNLFIDTYYNLEEELRVKEEKHIKALALNWIDYVLSDNEFDSSLKESFEVKKKLIIEYIK